MTKRYAVHNLRCAGCAARIEDAIAGLPGVKSAAINLDSARLRVEGEQPELAAMIRLADAIEPGTLFSEMDENEPLPESSEPQPSLFRSEYKLWIAAALFAVGMIFEERLDALLTPFVAKAVFFGIPYLLCGLSVLKKGLQSLLKFDFFNEYTLMGGATIAAAAIGQLPEAVGVMLFYSIGEALQDRAAGNSRRSIRALLAARPTVAHLIEEKDGKQMVNDADPSEIRPGMRILVKPGEKIPLDGTVLTGSSQVDTSPLTGESVPVSVGAGKQVYAGTVNLEGAITVEVTSRFADSSVARILELVENASEKKARTENFITRFARVYTPIVCAAALAIAVLPPLLGAGPWSDWVLRGLTFLVVSCPCALVISVPLSFFGGIGAASKAGILVKGSNYLEALSKVDTVVFDKTGTLTSGTFQVVAVHPEDGIHSDDLLATAAHAEAYSDHPIAVSLKEAYAGDIDNGRIEGAAEESGHGVTATVDGRAVLVGNDKLMAAHGIEHHACDVAGTLLHVAVDDAYHGHIVIADVVKDDAAQAIADLHAEGVKRCIMLTGDREEVAAAVAKELGIDAYRAQLLPQDKVEEVEKLLAAQPDGAHLAFVGDGINDAPVLTRADVGIAMGAMGSDAAIEAADIVLMDDKPSKIALAMRVARKTMRIVWQNIIFAIGVKVLILLLAAVGLANMWLAVFGDVGVAVIAILNAMRALKVASPKK